MVRDGEDVELIIHNHTVFVLAEREKEAFVEARLDLCVCIRTVTLVDVHGESVELLEAGHRPQ